ncbi:hypothetical protein Tco_1255769, partial [Tanacetum coccineum]
PSSDYGEGVGNEEDEAYEDVEEDVDYESFFLRKRKTITKKVSRFTSQDYLGNKVLEVFLQGDGSILLGLVGVVLDSWFRSRNRYVGFLGIQVRERQGGSRFDGWGEGEWVIRVGCWWGFEVGEDARVGFRKCDILEVVLVAHRQLEDKQPEDKTNTDCLVKKQEKEYQTEWKIKTGNVLDSCNQRSTQQSMKSGVAKKFRCYRDTAAEWVDDTIMSTYLVNRSPSSTIGFKKPIDMWRFFCWLASIEQGMLESVKVKCIFLGYHKRIVGNKLWRLDDVTSKVMLYRNMGFNESGEYKTTFIGSGVGTGSMQVLQGVEFEVEPPKDHTFEVEPHGNVDHVAEDNNEAAFLVAEAKKIYEHESLTFNDTVACEVISKWKAELKEDMDIRSDVYVLSNDCRKSSDDSHDYYWEYAPAKENVLGMKIIRDQSGSTLRVSQSMFYNEKLVQTLLEEHSILSLEGSLSGDGDVEKNGKWSCIYAVGSQEYQMTYRFFVDFNYAMGRSITVMGKINHKVRVDDTRMFRKLRSYDAAHGGFVNN